MKTRQLGLDGPAISALGLGCMVMSGDYGPAQQADSIATMHRAFEIGVNFFDTADTYGLGGNEELVGKALKGRRDTCILATKFGNVVNADGSRGLNARADYVARACDASLLCLGYRCHRPVLPASAGPAGGHCRDDWRDGRTGARRQSTLPRLIRGLSAIVTPCPLRTSDCRLAVGVLASFLAIMSTRLSRCAPSWALPSCRLHRLAERCKWRGRRP